MNQNKLNLIFNLKAFTKIKSSVQTTLYKLFATGTYHNDQIKPDYQLFWDITWATAVDIAPASSGLDKCIWKATANAFCRSLSPA